MQKANTTKQAQTLIKLDNSLLRSIDLNLLVILDQLLKTQHVSQAATQLHMSQPAVSRALQRLRQTFDDPLLVRTQQGYDLSARAKGLQLQLSQSLGQLERLIQAPHFEPAQAQQKLRIYSPDIETAFFLPPLMRLLNQQAPNMQLINFSQPCDHFQMLDQGDVHFAITAMQPDSNYEQLYQSALYKQDSIVCLMRADHPLACKKQLSLKQYLAHSHAVVAITGQGNTKIDLALNKLGHKRHIALHLSSFMAVAEFCLETDLLFALPQVLAQKLVKTQALAYKQLPGELGLNSLQIDFYCYWHQRHHHDPMCHWVRQKLQSLFCE